MGKTLYGRDLHNDDGRMNTAMMNSIRPGDHLRVHDALGRTLDATATSGVEEGYSFKIVWAALEGRDGAHAVPWPVDDVEKV